MMRFSGGNDGPSRETNGTASRLLGRLRAQGPTVLVLLLLAALGIWGWKHDWKTPAFAQLWSPTGEGGEAGGIAVSPEGQGSGCARTFERRTLTFPSPEAVAQAGIRCDSVTSRDLAEYVIANGVLDYNQNRIAHLATRVPGTAYRVLRHAGQTVKKGDILALVESADVGKAKAEFLQYLMLADVRRKIYEELKPSVVPKRTMQEAEASLREARIRLSNAQQTLVNLGMPISAAELASLPEARQVERVRLLGVEDLVHRRDIPGAEDLGRKLAAGEATSNLIPLKAPFDGTIISRDIVEGEIVHPQQVQFTVADIRTMWVMLDVRLEDTPPLTLGQPVHFAADAVKGLETDGKVDWISTDVDEKTRTVRVRAEVPNPDGRLRARTFGTGRITTRLVPGAVVVPETAVQHDLERHDDAEPGSAVESTCRVVFVRRSPTLFEARLVETGIGEAGWVQIQSGVALGEHVVTTGSHALKSEILKARIAGED